MMNNLRWHLGKTLKRSVEETGRSPHLEEYLVAAWLQAQEDGKSLEDMVHVLIAISDFEGEVKKLDKAKTIRDLGF